MARIIAGQKGLPVEKVYMSTQVLLSSLFHTLDSYSLELSGLILAAARSDPSRAAH